MPYLVGLGAVVGLWIAAGVATGTWSILKYVEGADGRPSTSKFQWLFWTMVVFFAYTVLYAARARYGYLDELPAIPQNVLLAMGFSAATMTAAKAITQSYLNGGKLKKPVPHPEDKKATAASALVNDDDGSADLSKIQMLGWTFLIAAIYLSRVVQIVGAYNLRDNDLTSLPDIDTALMVLMGLGHGAYVGKKAATTTPPQPAAERV